jgi:hypothetical protein
MMAMTDDADPVLVATRRSLHALAARVISPLRVQATGNEIALTPRPGGFGTPELPEGGWVGVRGTDLVRVDADGAEDRAPITSLLEAADFVGLDDRESDLPADPLEVHAGAAEILAGVWARGAEALAALIDTAPDDEDPSPIHLWPEHFDVATELGAEAAGRRATYGVSPGDDQHPEPYAYVAPWRAPAKTGPSTFWNAAGFTGAQRPVDDDPDDLLAFFRAARDLLSSDDGD